MKISQVKELVTKMFEEDDSLKYAIATNMAKYGRPDSRPGDKKAKLTKGLEKKREKHVLDLKKSMEEKMDPKEMKTGTYAGNKVVIHMHGPETEWKVEFLNTGKIVDYIDLMANLKFDDGTDYQDYLSENKEAEDAIRDTLSKEGGAAGLEPLVKVVKKFGINKEELVKLLKKLAKVKKHRDGDYILTPISEDDEDSAFPGESPSKGYMEARKLIDRLRATTFKKLNNDELYDFRKTIATAFDMSLREDIGEEWSKLRQGQLGLGPKSGIAVKTRKQDSILEDKIDLKTISFKNGLEFKVGEEDPRQYMKGIIDRISKKDKKYYIRAKTGSGSGYIFTVNTKGSTTPFENLSEDKSDLERIAKSLESQFEDLKFNVSGQLDRIDVRGSQQDMFNFGDKLHGKKFGEYEVFATDDDDRGEIVRIVRSDTISKNEGKKKKNPSMGIVRKKLGKVPKAGKVAYQKKMKLPTGLVNYMDYNVSEKKKKKDDRCTRIAKRKYDTWPSAYASGAVVRCRKGEIWKGIK